MWISYDKTRCVTAISDFPICVPGQKTKKIKSVKNPMSLVGNQVPADFLDREDYMRKPSYELRIAFICNWQTKCGISTYSKYLVDSLKPKVKEIRIFSEIVPSTTAPDGPEVERCWKRGESLIDMCQTVLDWSPDFIVIQHEYGIFPNAFYFMQMMQKFEGVPHIVTMHSVYQHLDKLVYSECVKNIVVHSTAAKDMLKSLGNTNNIHVVPHGCLVFDDVQELYNNCFNPYTIMQFGFGFEYKGVERALDALAILKKDPKFEKVFYFMLISENDFNNRAHAEYYQKLLRRVDEMGLNKNVALYRKYQTEQMLNYYLRLAKLAIFPYINNPNNTVFGASGATRIAIANKIPVIVSESHLFDDFDGVLPRPDSPEALAREIDEIFSNGAYRESIVRKSQDFIRENSWTNVADKYLAVYAEVAPN
jgi:glycosyltransferase involved in cell wall biosynthesis